MKRHCRSHRTWTNLEWRKWSTGRKLDKFSRHVAHSNNDWTVHTKCKLWHKVLNKQSVRTQNVYAGTPNSPRYVVFSHSAWFFLWPTKIESVIVTCRTVSRPWTSFTQSTTCLRKSLSLATLGSGRGLPKFRQHPGPIMARSLVPREGEIPSGDEGKATDSAGSQMHQTKRQRRPATSCGLGKSPWKDALMAECPSCLHWVASSRWARWHPHTVRWAHPPLEGDPLTQLLVEAHRWILHACLTCTLRWSRDQRRGVVIRLQQLPCAPRRMRSGIRNAVRMGTASVQSSRRYHVQGCAVSHQKREGPCRGREEDGTDHRLSTISVPLIVHALCLKEDEANSARICSHALPMTSALEMVPNTSPFSAPRLEPQLESARSWVTESWWCCQSVQAQVSEKWPSRALRMLGHSTLPNMFTRSRSATTTGSRALSASRGSRWPSSVPAPHISLVGCRSTDASPAWPARGVLAQGWQALDVRRAQEFDHDDGSGSAVFFQRCQQMPLWILLAWVLRVSVMCSARVPVEPGAARAAYPQHRWKNGEAHRLGCAPPAHGFRENVDAPCWGPNWDWACSPTVCPQRPDISIMDDSMLGIGFSGKHRLLPRVARGFSLPARSSRWGWKQGLELRPLSEHDAFGDFFSRSSAPWRGTSSLERPSPASACLSRPAVSPFQQRGTVPMVRSLQLWKTCSIVLGGRARGQKVEEWEVHPQISSWPSTPSYSIEIVNGRSDCGADGRTASKSLNDSRSQRLETSREQAVLGQFKSPVNLKVFRVFFYAGFAATQAQCLVHWI